MLRARSIMRRILRTSLVTLVAVGATLVGSLAQAQTPPLALDRFEPAPAGDRMFGVPSPFVAGDPALHVMLLGDYAHNPLVVARDDDGETVGAILEHQMFVHLNANLALWNRLGIDLNLPLAVVQEGESPAGVTSPQTAAFGDVRVGARLRIAGEYYDPLQLGVGGYVWIPTGDDTSFVSDGAARGMPYLALGGRVPHFLWTTSAGVELRRAQTFGDVGQGTMFHGGAGFGVLLGEDEPFQIGPEATVAVTFDDVQSRTTNAELLLDARLRIGDFEIGGGAGPGLSTGIGTPDVRGVFLLAYTPLPPRDRDEDGVMDGNDACPDVAGVASTEPSKNGCPQEQDRDQDGIVDGLDACPELAGVASSDPAKHGCPAPGDRDRDKILDADDACPDLAGVASEDRSKNGCPLDGDGDGVYDLDDACPELPGVRTSEPATNGCPGDRDGDGIRDDQDACPDEKGSASSDPKKNGCPGLVRVTDEQIVILQQVQFDTGKATIRGESDGLLDEVATVLKDHPEVLRLEVQGYTDNRGGKGLNAQLSKARAKSVLDALVKRGVASDRLTSQGYGQDKPIADNTTDEGRQRNRRVQFVILEKKKAER